MPSPVKPVNPSRCAYQFQQCFNQRAVNDLGEQLELCDLHLIKEQLHPLQQQQHQHQHEETKPKPGDVHLAFSDISDLLEGSRRLQLPLELNEVELREVDALLSEHDSQ